MTICEQLQARGGPLPPDALTPLAGGRTNSWNRLARRAGARCGAEHEGDRRTISLRCPFKGS